jgi:hypothetical protein
VLLFCGVQLQEADARKREGGVKVWLSFLQLCATKVSELPLNSPFRERKRNDQAPA